MNQLQSILTERPSFHSSETEINRRFEASESFLPREKAEKLASSSLTCYGIESAVLSFIAEFIDEKSQTLEVGAGCSTLVFAIKRSNHIVLTPSHSEIELITAYAHQKQIPLNRTHFVCESSERFLPQCQAVNLDLVLLDGKHAFPWPIVDWFYTADRLREGGVMIIDDVPIRSVAILAEFMKVDPGWELLHSFSRALAFKKIRSSIHDVAWHMQPFSILPSTVNSKNSLVSRVSRKLKRVLIGRSEVLKTITC
jgi:predicted O-methyltransferase YrrM